MESLINLVTQNYVTLIIGFVIVLGVISLIKSVVKWILTVLIVVGILIFAYNNMDDLKDYENIASAQVLEDTKNTVLTDMLGSTKGWEYTEEKDGSYKLSKDKVSISGKLGEKEAKLSLNGFTVSISVTEDLLALLTNLQKEG